MIPRDQVDGHAKRGDFDQGFHGHLHGAGGHERSEQQITPVHDEVDLPLPRRFESPPEIGEEVVPPASSRDPRLERQIESNMSVGNE